MFTEYLDCRIEFQPRNGDAFPFSISAPGGDARGSLILPTTNQDYKPLAEKLEQLTVDEEILTQIGQTLFEALFQGPVKEVFVRSQGRLQDRQGLRLVLNTAASEQEVGALPWEFLNDPDQGPLTLRDMPIVRYLQQSAVIPQLKTELPLKVLLSGATPRGQPPINVERELNEVASALEGLVQAGRVQIMTVPHLTRSQLQPLLRQNFHVWHFAGHGGFKPDGKTSMLHFEDAQGDLESVAATELGLLLNRSVRLVVLDACQSGKLQTEPFRSMAPALIRAQIPAVIAMQFKVLDAAAQAFAGEFYRALAEGFPIDACVTEGRKAVMGAVGLGRADWGIPVVYTRAADGKLFDLPAAAVKSTTATPVGTDDQPAAASNDTSSADDRTTKIDDLRQVIRTKRRQLHELEMQKAAMGTYTPPYISMGITDTERDIAKLEQQLKQLGG